MDTMNTETTTQAEVTADAAVAAVEDVIYAYEWAQDISRGMLKDANEGVEALRLLVNADEEFDRLAAEIMQIVEKEGPLADDDPRTQYLNEAAHARAAALAACRAVGGAR